MPRDPEDPRSDEDMQRLESDVLRNKKARESPFAQRRRAHRERVRAALLPETCQAAQSFAAALDDVAIKHHGREAFDEAFGDTLADFDSDF